MSFNLSFSVLPQHESQDEKDNHISYTVFIQEIYEM